MQIEKEEVNVSLFVAVMIVCIIDHKISIRELLQLINAFCKVAGYKMNSEKSLSHLYTNDRLRKKLGKQHLSQ